MESITRTQDELLAELTERFGADPMTWAFECPACKDVATVRDFREALARDPARYEGKTAADFVGLVCIGRVSGALIQAGTPYSGRGCDWSANGLFRGPDFVTMPNGDKVGSFRIAPVQ